MLESLALDMALRTRWVSGLLGYRAEAKEDER
jgi:hypothetical protein